MTASGTASVSHQIAIRAASPAAVQADWDIPSGAGTTTVTSIAANPGKQGKRHLGRLRLGRVRPAASTLARRRTARDAAQRGAAGMAIRGGLG